MRLIILGVLICIIGILAFISSDMGRATFAWGKEVMTAVEDKSQLQIKQIHVSQTQYTTRKEIEKEIGVSRGDPILKIDLDAIRQRIEKLPWIRSCVVERYLPDELYIHIQEKVPIAIWQNNKQYHPLDEMAQPIQTSKKMPSDLLLVVGENAPERLLNLLQNLETVPDIHQYVRAAVRIGNRRWNLKLFDVEKGVEIILPEDDEMLSALKRLSKSEQKEKLLKRKVRAIDVRQKDKIILKPLEEVKKTPKGKKK